MKIAEKPFKEPIDGVLYAAACGIKNKGQIEKSEKPIEELNEAAENYAEDMYGHILNGNEDLQKVIVCIRDFKAGAQWGAEHLKKEEPPVSEGLEEVADTILLKLLTENKESYPFDSTGMRFPRDCFKAGAKWQKEQMMNETVEGWVSRDLNGCLYFHAEEPYYDGIDDCWMSDEYLELPEKMFPEIEHTSKPVKVKLIVLKNELE